MMPCCRPYHTTLARNLHSYGGSILQGICILPGSYGAEGWRKGGCAQPADLPFRGFWTTINVRGCMEGDRAELEARSRSCGWQAGAHRGGRC